ncbi:FecR family protein [Maribellus maritimus]|uniref:FecR family protein n=1 Tax=Maribellus maritimus TaxID=2870838 RepID=UPI001EE9BE13|nr:FecR domain-containing protein [Maribellus maritimus]MCG6190670.1 DUF4974 domain-containing protein [Maribellus maritimus]
MAEKKIDNIILKSLSSSLNNEEKLTLNKWISVSEQNRKEYDAYKKLWDESEKLVFSESIDVERSLKKTKSRISGLQTKKSWIIYLRQAAAVLLLALALNFAYNYLIRPEKSLEKEQTVHQEIKAAFGTQTKILLADGSYVWLNSGSSLRFPASFRQQKVRKVELNGEAFFEVAHNEEKPFIVNTSAIDVKVHGTSFNVSAYNDYNTISVALVEGKVSLVKNFENELKNLITLHPNEVVEYNVEKNELYSTKEMFIDKYIAWKEGKIVFYGDPIDMVVKRLEKWYNVKIIVDDNELKNYRFTATFVDESLEQVLKLLSLSSPIEYKITPAQKKKDNSFSMRIVTLSKKQI